MAFGFFKKKNYADSIFCNCNIVPLSEEYEGASAIAVRGGKIISIGVMEDLEDLKGPETNVVDLGGKFLTPGFSDPFASVSENVFKDSYLALDSSLKNSEAFEKIKYYASKNSDRDYILVCGWTPDKSEFPEEAEAGEAETDEEGEAGPKKNPIQEAMDIACPERPLILIAADGLSMHLNTSAAAIVKERVEELTFRTSITPSFVMDCIASVDIEAVIPEVFAIAEDYASRGYTSVQNISVYSYFENMYRDLLLEFFQAGLIKQRYFGSMPLRNRLNPLSYIYNIDKYHTDCSELGRLINFEQAHITACAEEGKAGYMDGEYLKSIAGAVADKGFNLRIDALDKDTAKIAADVLGNISTSHKKSAFTLCTDEVFSDEELGELFTGDISMFGLKPETELKGSGAEMLRSVTEKASLQLGDIGLGSIEEGKFADFAVFSTNPENCSSPEEFRALRAEMTVLGGEIVYTKGGDGAKEWTEAMTATLSGIQEELFE